MDVVKIARAARVAREVKLFESQAPWGITCRPENEDCLDSLCVILQGPKDSPYENGCFKIIVTIPERYPFEPPLLKFVTPVYHPNIDKGGRICMDMLKMPPNGGWVPTITLETLLVSLQTLLANPNPDDPLMLEIAHEFKNNKELFTKNASKYTEEHAIKVNKTFLSKARKRLSEREMTEKRAKYEAKGMRVDSKTLEKAQQEYEEYKKSKKTDVTDIPLSQNNENNTPNTEFS